MLPITANKPFSKIGSNFIELAEVNSTNSYAIEMVQANLAVHGYCFFAHEQTAGKGQHGKVWQSNKGENIILSCVIDSSFLSIHQQFLMSICIAVACYDFISAFAGDETAIKWPNDIYWRDRKAAGILLENVVRGVDWKWCIAGIGINVNQTSFAIDGKNPVSLKQITGKQFDTVLMAKELCEKLEARYQELRKGKQEALLLAYNNVLYKKNQPVKLKKGNASFYCTIDKVAINGCLEVKNAAQESFDFGEIEWVL